MSTSGFLSLKVGNNLTVAKTNTIYHFNIKVTKEEEENKRDEDVRRSRSQFTVRGSGFACGHTSLC